MSGKRDRSNQVQRWAECSNAVTHGIGIVLAIIATAFLGWKGLKDGQPLPVISYTTFGISMILLYTASTIYHCLRHTRFAKKLRVLDHAGIFLLIAGTYTPVALLVIGDRAGVALTLSIWLLALAGIVIKVGWLERAKRLSTLIYIFMGWLVLFFIKPFYENISTLAFWCILAGGLVYTFGTVFYRMKQRAFAHTIWHLFVMAGSSLMFVGIFFGI